MWRAALVTSTLALALQAVCACRTEGLPGAAEPDGEGQIALRNRSSREAWYAYSRRCGARTWGEDELGPRLVLRPGQSAAWGEAPGCYDLLVLTNPRVEPRYEARYPRRQVAAEQETAVAIADADWGPSDGAPAAPPGPIP